VKYAALEYARNQYKKARELFALGMIVNPKHGPLYHAYGNMELVSKHHSFSLILLLPALICHEIL
jgi:hypothetical protein